MQPRSSPERQRSMSRYALASPSAHHHNASHSMSYTSASSLLTTSSPSSSPAASPQRVNQSKQSTSHSHSPGVPSPARDRMQLASAAGTPSSSASPPSASSSSFLVGQLFSYFNGNTSGSSSSSPPVPPINHSSSSTSSSPASSPRNRKVQLPAHSHSHSHPHPPMPGLAAHHQTSNATSHSHSYSHSHLDLMRAPASIQPHSSPSPSFSTSSSTSLPVSTTGAVSGSKFATLAAPLVLNRPDACHQCGQTFNKGDESCSLTDVTSRAFFHYHRGHMICSVCCLLLTPENALCKDGALYCRPHWPNSRVCHSCKQVIVGRGLQVGGHAYHTEHVRCTFCEIPMTEGQTMFELKGRLFCASHPDGGGVELECSVCSQRAPLLEMEMSRDGSLYHPACIKCSVCSVHAQHASLHRTGTQLLCDQDFDALMNHACAQCGLVIRVQEQQAIVAAQAPAGTSPQGVAQTHAEFYHASCLNCEICQVALTEYSSSYGQLRCVRHQALRSEAPICDFCDSRIDDPHQLVKALGRKWHQRCFQCDLCHQQLDGSKCTTLDGKPCCHACWIQSAQRTRGHAPAAVGDIPQTGSGSGLEGLPKSAGAILANSSLSRTGASASTAQASATSSTSSPSYSTTLSLSSVSSSNFTSSPNMQPINASSNNNIASSTSLAQKFAEVKYEKVYPSLPAASAASSPLNAPVPSCLGATSSSMSAGQAPTALLKAPPVLPSTATLEKRLITQPRRIEPTRAAPKPPSPNTKPRSLIASTAPPSSTSYSSVPISSQSALSSPEGEIKTGSPQRTSFTQDQSLLSLSISASPSVTIAEPISTSHAALAQKAAAVSFHSNSSSASVLESAITASSAPASSPRLATSPAPRSEASIPASQPSAFSSASSQLIGPAFASSSSTSTASSPSSSPSSSSAVPLTPRRMVAPPISVPKIGKLGDNIGHGGTSMVYEARDEITGEHLAVKVIKVGAAETEKRLGIEKEIALLSSLRHEHIVKFKGTQQHNDSLYIFMEFVAGKSLDQELHSWGRMTESLIIKYTRQLLEALAYCHAHGVIHRDIKSKNILIARDGLVKLCDFGSAKQMDQGVTSANISVFGYTPIYLAPEMMGDRYDSKCDIWSLGCCVIEMASGKTPWSEKNFPSIWTAMSYISTHDEIPAIPETLSTEGQIFVRSMLARDPRDRLSAAELLQKPYMTSVRAADAGASLLSLTAPAASNSYASATPPSMLMRQGVVSDSPPQPPPKMATLNQHLQRVKRENARSTEMKLSGALELHEEKESMANRMLAQQQQPQQQQQQQHLQQQNRQQYHSKLITGQAITRQPVPRFLAQPASDASIQRALPPQILHSSSMANSNSNGFIPEGMLDSVRAASHARKRSDSQSAKLSSLYSMLDRR